MTVRALRRIPEPEAAPTTPRWAWRRVVLVGLGVAVAIAASVYGHRWWEIGRFLERTDDAYAGGDATAIAPHVGGFVAELAVIDNQYVRAGQLLLRLDDRDFRVAIERAADAVRQREAALASLHARRVLQDPSVRQARADLSAKTARSAFAHADAARYEGLAATKAISRQEAERAATVDEEAQAAAAAATAALDAAKQQLVVLDAEVAAGEADLAQAHAGLERARLDLAYTEIRSPVDGYVGNRAAQVGEYVTEGSYLLTIIPAHGLWVDANFKEDQVARMAPGQPAMVVADAYSGHVLHGRVASLRPGTGAIFSIIPPENATGNFTKIVQRVPVRIALEPSDATLGRLRPGLSTTVTVDTRHTR